MALSASQLQDIIMRSRVLLFLLGCVFGLFVVSMLRQSDRIFSRDLHTDHLRKGVADPQKDHANEQHKNIRSITASPQVASTGVAELKSPNPTDAYDKALLKYASPKSVVILSSVDFAYISLAKNLYYTSFKKLNIDNYLFVASDPRVCPVLNEEHIHCVDYLYVSGGDKAEPFYKNIFKLKSFMKTKVVLRALQLKLTVLLVDVDMVFLKNPFEHFSCADCDMECMSEWEAHGVINTGFYLAKPTAASITLHDRSNQIMDNETKINHLRGSDQMYINEVLKAMHGVGKLKYKLLNDTLFSNARVFFEDGKRFFRGENPCSECVVVHNNFIISLDAKIYRFKEYGMWDVDDNGYYSSKVNKYLTYENPIEITPSTTPAEVIIRETDALKTALKVGTFLSRYVILPKFHNFREFCQKKKCVKNWETCSLQGLYYIEHFNMKLRDKYRENSFLAHPKVPKSVKESISPVYMFESPLTKNFSSNVLKDVNVMHLMDMQRGVSKDELKTFDSQTRSHAVLRFHSMHFNALIHVIEKELKTTFTRASYTQHHKGGKFMKKFNVSV